MNISSSNTSAIMIVSSNFNNKVLLETFSRASKNTSILNPILLASKFG